MITTDQVADHLDKTAVHLETHGWIQGLMRDPHAYDVSACRTCLRGALSAAAGRHPRFAEDWQLITEAEEAVAAWLRAKGELANISGWDAGDLLEDWNDARDRTAEQVISALRECAAGLRTAVSA